MWCSTEIPKRILILSRKSPYGLSDGVKIRTYNFAKILSKYYKVDLICQEDVEIPNELYDPFDRKYIFKTNKVLMILRALKTLVNGKSIVYRHFDPEIKKFIDDCSNNYEFIYCNYIHTAVNAIHCKQRKIVDLYDAISLHYKEAIDIGFLRKILYKIDYKRVLKLESETVEKADLCLVTTSNEKDFLVKNTTALVKKLNNIKVLTHGVTSLPINNEEVFCKFDKKDNDRVIGFLGNLDYYPNEAGATYLLRHIYPECKKRYPYLKCMVIGANPTQKILKLSKMEGVIVTDFVKDLKDAISCVDVMVLPMKIASGIQNKLITSMGYGKAVVVPHRAIFDNENLKDGFNLMIADSNIDYIQKTLQLLGDEEKRRTIGENAKSYVQTKLNWENIEKSLMSYIEEALRNSVSYQKG